jgi:NADH-quinone oxidoreductase subunit L
MLDAAWLIPALPLAGFVLILLFGRRLGDPKAGYLATAMCAAAFAVTIAVFFDLLSKGEEGREHVTTVFSWVPVGSLKVDLAFLVDPLSVTMCLFVTGIGALIHLYAVGYMHGDPRFSKFFLYLNLFAVSMLLLVLGENMLVTFLGWEGVGTCSYLLISFWHERDSAATAGKKAFVTNRVGDWGFMLAMFFAFQATGTLSYIGVNAQAHTMAQTTATAIALFAFIGACGKSAQLPLYLWLPDAMEGPTPVSALIHAATMVTAGIYLIARNYVFYENGPNAMLVVALVGTFTSFMAATIAIAQNDIKRVVAYSTLSQLGYMAMGAGVGAFIPSIFHLATHAFFKGLLFLGAGSVIHGMHEEQNIQNMGGLRRYMPITFWTFLIASLANAGLVPFAGFWSKDEIIVGSWVTTAIPVGKILAIVGLVTAFFTAYYMFRLVFLVFTGEPRFNTHDIHPHESPLSMSIPLVLLAIPSAILGLWIGVPPEGGRIHAFLDPVFEHPFERSEGDEVASLYLIQEEQSAAAEEPAGGEHHVSQETIIAFGIISTIVALAGIFTAWLTYGKQSLPLPEVQSPALFAFLRDKWRWDELYNDVIVSPLQRFATWLWQVVDVRIIDGAVNGVANGIGAVSQRLRLVQTGLVTNYALAIALGMVVLVGIYLGLASTLFR